MSRAMNKFLQKAISLERKEIDEAYEELRQRELDMQAACSHPNVSKKAGHSEEGWSNPASYWYDFVCPDCDKRWTEEQ